MLYLDSSIIVPMLWTEATTDRVESWMRNLPAGQLTTSQWARLEILSIVAREIRVGKLNPADAREIDADFEDLLARSFEVLQPSADDFETAKSYLRRYETGLRGGDALHLAIAANRRAKTIYTLDRGMLKAGRTLGLPVESGID